MASPSQSSPLLHLLNLTRNPNPSSILTPELCDLLSDQLIPSESDGPDFTDFLLSTQKELRSYRASLVQAQNNENALPVQPAQKRRRNSQPSKELVRASSSCTEDLFKSRVLVRKVRIAYDSLRCHYQLESSSEKSGKNSEKSGKQRQFNRFDMNAYAEMKNLGMLSFLSSKMRVVGPIPGVEIGDIFFYRAELCLLGLHTPVQAGINYSPSEFTDEKELIALSVVASGGYQNDEELGENKLLYTGSGGKGRNDSHVSSDQTLERGNLALERSFHYGVELRVIRGITHKLGPSKVVYVYDGLYRVVNYKQENESGNKIYRFELERMPRQEESGIKLLRIAEEMKAKLAEGAVPGGYLSRDISKGKEKIPVPFFNDIDGEDAPLVHEYVKCPKYPSSSIRSAMKGCKCKSGCSDGCACRKRNGGTFAYDGSGVLLQGRPVVYECGETCQCPATCPNRVSQKGMRYQLEVYRSEQTQWGVRSLDPIQAGMFICEFGGDVVLREMVQNSLLSFHFIDPISFPQRWREWGNLSEVLPGWKMTDSPLLLVKPGYLLDVSRRCNVACYISHSPSPNAFVQYVLYAHDHVRFPRMMVFALENIPPLRELSLDYGI